MILHIVRTVLGTGCFLLSALLAMAFEARYWRWRDCFNELGRCYDPATQDVYLEQSGIVWGGLSAISLLIGLRLLWKPRRMR